MASFDLILPLAEKGVYFRRKGWLRWAFIHPRHGFAQESDQFGAMPRHISTEDILAKDWEIKGEHDA